MLGTQIGGVVSDDYAVQTHGNGYNNNVLTTIDPTTCNVTNGYDTTASGLCAQAGTPTTAASGASAYGAYATASGANGTAVGFRSIAAGVGSVAMGFQSQATGAGATAIGMNSLAQGAGSVAIGPGASATAANSVALGSNSVANAPNTVSVGSVGAERQITNVAPGVNPTDAANMAQLNQVKNYALQTARYAFTGVAGATALSMIPQVEPGKRFALGIGLGDYRGYGAVALGGSARVTDHIVVKGGVSLSNSDPSYGIGAAVSW
ncbi:MAG TPA: YadA-like family protein [Caulobacteraceae bacterium]|nr:YadA-like family protein [Caulobacteraceae bacterium]